MSKKQLNKEEQYFSDKLNELQYEYQEADWNALEEKLPSSGNSSWLSSKGFIGGIAAIALISSIAYFSTNKQVVEETTIPSKDIEASEVVIKEESDTEEAPSMLSSNEEKQANQEIVNSEVEKKVSKRSPIQSSETNEKVTPKLTKEEDQKEQQAPIEEKNNNQTKESKSPVQSNEGLSFDLKLPDYVCSNGIHLLMMETADLPPEGYFMHWQFKYEDEENKDPYKEADYLIAQIKDESGNVVKTIDKKINIINADAYTTDFSYEDSDNPYSDLLIRFEAKENGMSDFRWTCENTSMDTKGKMVEYAFEQKGIYDIQLEAKSPEGCLVKVIKPISVDIDFDPLAPNAFTPNQDGNNDVFIVEGFKNRNDHFKMEIFDLQGQLIYRSSDSKEGWNGQMNNNGQMMPEGIYVWKINISNDKGQQKSFAGNLRLMSRDQ